MAILYWPSCPGRPFLVVCLVRYNFFSGNCQFKKIPVKIITYYIQILSGITFSPRNVLRNGGPVDSEKTLKWLILIRISVD